MMAGLPAAWSGSLTPLARATTYVVGVPSLHYWFEHFAILGTDDLVVSIEEREDGDDVVSGMHAEGRMCVFLSSHETLPRDRDLAVRLRRLGIRTLAQSPTLTEIGVDKTVMKRFFDRVRLATAPWATRATFKRFAASHPAHSAVVVKKVRSTQSAGIRLTTLRRCDLADNEYCELFIAGTEFSMVLYRDDERLVMFPPVWKGATTRDLVPPWRRLRLCPGIGVPRRTTAALLRSAALVARRGNLQGYMEVEFIVAGDEVFALEVNPRIAGTMRIAALSARHPLFGLHHLPPGRWRLAAVSQGVEMPFHGFPFIDPTLPVFSTSRLTVGGDDIEEVLNKLRSLEGHAPVDPDMMDQLRQLCAHTPANQVMAHIAQTEPEPANELGLLRKRAASAIPYCAGSV